MATNQEWIEHLEKGMNKKLHQFETTLSKLLDLLISIWTSSPNHLADLFANSLIPHMNLVKEENRSNYEGGRKQFTSKLAQLEFPKFYGHDPI